MSMPTMNKRYGLGGTTRLRRQMARVGAICPLHTLVLGHVLMLGGGNGVR